MSRLLYLESKSLDELEELSKNKEMMAEAIPAIWPVNKRNLRGHIGHSVPGAIRSPDVSPATRNRPGRIGSETPFMPRATAG
ncbi:MAG: hypothetical protein ACLR8Y_18720 [Alistipes indistinctus]